MEHLLERWVEQLVEPHGTRYAAPNGWPIGSPCGSTSKGLSGALSGALSGTLSGAPSGTLSRSCRNLVNASAASVIGWTAYIPNSSQGKRVDDFSKPFLWSKKVRQHQLQQPWTKKSWCSKPSLSSWWQLTHEGWSSRAFRGRFWSLLQMMKPPIVLIPKASKTSKAKRKRQKPSLKLCKRHFMLRRRNARKTSSLKWCSIDKHQSKNFYFADDYLTVVAFQWAKLTDKLEFRLAFLLALNSDSMY